MVKKVASTLMVVNSRVPGHIYNRLYRLDINKDCLIKDKIDNGIWNWNWSRTNLGSRNHAYFRDMLNEIGDVNIEVAEDTCYWSLGSNGVYTVKEARQIIDLKTLPSLDLQTTWDKVLPRKVNIFLWRMSLDRLPHRLNLSSRVWRLVNNWCEISLSHVTSYEEHQTRSSSWNVSKDIKHRFYVISASVLWWLWRFRNCVTFNSHAVRKSDIFDNVRSSSFSWLNNRGKMNFSWTDWLKSPLFIACPHNG
ncbi:hypothetical protein Tco_0604364 [Tanacetum coccineum]